MNADAETGKIWSRMHERLLAYIRRHVATVQDAEDILQDVFVRIHANLHRLRDTETITAWIYRITRNAITDYHRGRAKAAGAIKTLAEGLDGTAESPHEDDSTNDTVAQPSAELAGCMEPLLSGLPERYHQAITLTELDGLTQTEAAEKLGLSVSGMKSRVQRGREKLKEVLLDCCNVELDRRRGVIDYEPRDEGGCDKCDCR